VAEVKGVRFIDDSKGTNVDAVVRAIQSISGSTGFQPGQQHRQDAGATGGGAIWLILGGRDKGNDYQPLIPLVRERVKGILAIGESREKVNQFFQDIIPVYCADSFKDAVHRGFSMASAGDSVLLSPACASFDMFESYAHRGQVFKQLVQELKDSHQ
jgi:UDP-N-acetylmuramoylalanine--D-glutamate ligase